jgi:hypothetical protein
MPIPQIFNSALTLVMALITFQFFATSSKAQHIYTMGPTVHFNIGNGLVKTSYGLEFSFWDISNFPGGFNVGIEGERKAFRLYSEGQTGIGILGLSLGPYLELRKETPIKIGLQGSGWVNYIVGIDMRFRTGNTTDHFSPGLYAKFLWEDGISSNNSHSNNNVIFYHHHH